MSLRKRIFVSFIVLTMLLQSVAFATAPAAELGTEAFSDVYAEFSSLSSHIYASNFDELQDAIASLAGFGGGIIVVNDNIDFIDVIYLNNIEITLIAEGNYELANASDVRTLPAFVLGSGAVLNLGSESSMAGNLTITGFNTANENSPIVVDNGAVLNLYDNVSIYRNTAMQGGGITVNSGGVFNMQGGLIASNNAATGGGVYMTGTATFNMTGGTIDDNSANGHKISNESTVGYGGGVFANGGLFNMTGGVISSNRTTQTGNGGGVALTGNAIFNMSGSAEIVNNESRRMHGSPAGGNGSAVRVSSGATFNMLGGNPLIADNHTTGIQSSWGAISVEGTFNMYEGTITRNLSSNANSNAIHFETNSGTVNMYGGVIENNGNQRAGANAVLVSDHNTFNMYDGVIRDQNGPAVHLSSASTSGVFSMSGGRITENRGSGISMSSNSRVNISDAAEINNNSNAGDGGGIRITGINAIVTMTGGTIAENTATGRGGGISLAGTDNAVNMFGGAIADNTSLGIANGTQSQGGGVYIRPDSDVLFSMIGEASLQTPRIENNHLANNGQGGGVFVGGGTFNMQGGVVQHHTINGTLSRGGGVFVGGAGTFLLAEGLDRPYYPAEIRHNSVGGIGGGVFVDGVGIMRMNTSSINHNFAGLDGGGLGLGIQTSGSTTMLERFNDVLSNIIVADIGGAGASIDNNTAGNGTKVNTILALSNLQVMPTSGNGFDNNDIHSFLMDAEVPTIGVTVANHRLLTNDLAGALDNVEPGDMISIYRAPDIAENTRFGGWIFTDEEGNAFIPIAITPEEYVAGIGWHTQFVMPNHSVTVIGVWEYMLTYTKIPAAGGKVTVIANNMPVAIYDDTLQANSVWVEENSIITVTGEANSPLWNVVAMDVTGSSFSKDHSDMPRSIVGIARMSAATNVDVRFERVPSIGIVIEVDENGDITANVPNLIENTEISEGGTIVITLSPETDVDDVVVITPEGGWLHEITEDEDGNIIVTIMPPSPSIPQVDIDITTDNNGNIVIIAPPSIDYDKNTDGNGNIIITFPPNTGLDEDSIAINLPPDWEHEVNTDGSGNIIVTITPPPSSIPQVDIEITADNGGSVVIIAPPDINYNKSIGEDGNIVIVFSPSQNLDVDNIIVNLPTGWKHEIKIDEGGNIIVSITPPKEQDKTNPNYPTGEDNSYGQWWANTPTQQIAQNEQSTELEYGKETVAGIHHAFLIGFADNTIQPNGLATRAQIATIFFRLMSDSDRAKFWKQDSSFSDVGIDDWFNNAVSTTANAGIFIGMPEGTFQPNREVTRAEFTASVIRFMNLSKSDTRKNMFDDIATHWAAEYINIAANNAWVSGYEGLGGRFMPDDVISRAEVAAIINRALGRLPESAYDLLPDMITWVDNSDKNAWGYMYIQEATNSHYYTREVDSIHETWEQLIIPRTWEVLEHRDSKPEDIYAPK